MNQPPSSDDPARLPRLQGFQRLMPFRVREVLLVASRYDSFILEEEGQITDLILREYDRLNLRYAPRLNPTHQARDALRLLASDRRFDLVLVTMHLEDMDPADFAREVRRRFPGTPVVLLGYDDREFRTLLESPDARAFDRTFVWTGDARILLAAVGAIEDERNAEADTRGVGVEVIVLVEDSIHFISSVLPIVYGKLMKQSQRLITEGVTLAHSVLRMRARPKVLLASSDEEARALIERFEGSILGVISDVEFRRGGRPDPEAGFALARDLRAANPDLPVILLSTNAAAAARAADLGVTFLRKDSPRIKRDLEGFMLESFGFGPFTFRMPGGEIVATAQNLDEFRRHLDTVPGESIRYHMRRRHFATWLRARTEFRLADRLTEARFGAIEDPETLRSAVLDELTAFQRETYRDTITAFDPETFGSLSTFARIGGGSLGGKARGLAFLNIFLHEHDLRARVPGVDIQVPPAVVLGTEVFDRYVDANGLAALAQHPPPDEEIRRRFLDVPLPHDVEETLRALAAVMRHPCAVRSSSLLEDSRHQPFAGVYETYMLPGAATVEQHARDLSEAIRLVYASVYSERARTYLAATPARPEKEKMAVIVQKLVGQPHGDRFYPSFAGVGRSYDYYAVGHVQPEDGVALVALGLGSMVMDGITGLRFCPRHPRHLPQLSTVDDILDNAQTEFHALSLAASTGDPHARFQPTRLHVAEALADGTLGPVGAMHDASSDAVYDGTARPGRPLVTFAGILKHGLFPLPELLSELLPLGTRAMSTPIEIEFAVDLEADPPVFACLQIRPLTVSREIHRTDLRALDQDALLCESPRALGNGRIDGIRDVVCVVPEAFDRRSSVETADAIAVIDARLRAKGRPYVLIGPGRWGSADPWLGIPVNWGQIAGARIIVETGFDRARVTPSEGSHFFHNMTAFGVAYMTTNPQMDQGFIDWTWLLARTPAETQPNGLRVIRLEEPLLGLIDGRTGHGVIVKGEAPRRTDAADRKPGRPKPTGPGRRR